MAKVDEITKKAAEVAEEVERVRHKRDAKRLGFDDLDDYKLWLALETLRNRTLDLRRENREGSNQSIKLTTPQLGFHIAG